MEGERCQKEHRRHDTGHGVLYRARSTAVSADRRPIPAPFGRSSTRVTISNRSRTGPEPIPNRSAGVRSEGSAERDSGDDSQPDNIFLVERPGEPPLVKIVDFGIAKALGAEDKATQQLTKTGYLLGTPQYMSPEQINGVGIDPRSDIYALGIILYEMCTGATPFRGETLGQLLIAHLSQLPTIDPTQLGESVPKSMEPVLQKALAKDPKDRYESAQNLSQDLDRLVSGESPEATTWYQERKTQIQTGQIPTALLTLAGPTLVQTPRQRRLWLAGIGGTVVLIAALGGLGGYLYSRRVHAPPTKPVTQKVKKLIKKPPVDMLALRSDALKILQDALKDAEPQPRAQAVAALAATRDTRHITLLAPRLDDSDAVVQVAAAQALGQIGARSGVQPLVQRAEKTTDPTLLVAIGESLDRLGDPVAVQVLQQVYKDKNAGKAQLQAALALEEHDDKKAKKFVEKRIKKPVDEGDKPLIFGRRAKRGDQDAQKELTAELEGLQPGLGQLRLAGALAKLNIEAGRALLTKTEQTEGPLQVLAAQLLCVANEPSGLPLLRKVFAEAGRPPAERLVAVEGLGACGDKSDAVALAQTIKTEASPLLKLAEAGAVLKLSSGDPAVLAEQSLSWAQTALTDENWAVRESAVALLGDSDPQAAVPLLGKAIKDARPEVRRSAALALGRTKYKPALNVLSQAIGDDSKEVRVNVLRSIGKVNTDLVKKGEAGIDGELKQQIAAELVKRADGGDAAEQVVAAATLLRIGDDSRKDKLKQGLAADDPEIKALAIEESAADPVLQKASLADLLKDKVFSVRFKVACELGEQGDKQAVPVLKEGLGQGGADGLRAFGLLKKLGEPATPPKNMGGLLDSPDAAVRLAVLDATGRLEATESLPILSKAAKDKDVQVRRRVVDLLADWPAPTGPTASPALLVAQTLAGDSDVAVRSRAGLIAARLSPKLPDPEPQVVEVEEPVTPSGPATQAPSDTPVAPTPPPAIVPDLLVPPDLSVPRDMAVPADLTAPRDLAPPAAPDLLPAAAAPATVAAAAPGAAAKGKGEEDEDAGKSKEAKIKKGLAEADKYKQSGEYDQMVSALERVQKLDPTKNLGMQLGQAYELWAGEESGGKAKTLTKKAIDSYKKSKSAAGRAKMEELQGQLE